MTTHSRLYRQDFRPSRLLEEKKISSQSKSAPEWANKHHRFRLIKGVIVLHLTVLSLFFHLVVWLLIPYYFCIPVIYTKHFKSGSRGYPGHNSLLLRCFITLVYHRKVQLTLFLSEHLVHTHKVGYNPIWVDGSGSSVKHNSCQFWKPIKTTNNTYKHLMEFTFIFSH